MIFIAKTKDCVGSKFCTYLENQEIKIHKKGKNKDLYLYSYT